jgi:hypothetical protein
MEMAYDACVTLGASSLSLAIESDTLDGLYNFA